MMDIELALPVIGDGEDKSSPFKNCIRKNYKHIRKWAKRTSTNCFRIYDREIAHYPLAIDYYDGRFCIHYFARSRDEEEIPQALEKEVKEVLEELLNATAESIYWKSRIKRAKVEQYEKQASKREFFTVYEHGVKFKVNLIDYLDTGLFLDHRATRQLVASECLGKRLLNLFSYTCAFSVIAACAGARFTKSVDLSNTYTAWGRDNFELNGFNSHDHPVVREDCLRFLDQERARGLKYDLIVIDPPTVSRSKKMEGMFDVQLDYATLIDKALHLLDKEGAIFFSTNLRSFKFDASLFPACEIRDLSVKTLPIDFHDPLIHKCWKLKKR